MHETVLGETEDLKTACGLAENIVDYGFLSLR